MSIFLIHQTQSYAVMLADSLATKEHPSGAGTISTSASKLAHVSPGIYAAHAGTWQPAWAMLSDLHHATTGKGRRLTHSQLLSALKQIGQRRYKEYQRIFGRKSFDVRIALVVTGGYRSSAQASAATSTSVILWEAARDFVPEVVTGQLYFAGNTPLTNFVRHTLGHDVLQQMLRASPLAATQALCAAHQAAALTGSSISTDANVAVISAGAEHAVLRGSMLTLPMSALALG
jgi:hypothetical protein